MARAKSSPETDRPRPSPEGSPDGTAAAAPGDGPAAADGPGGAAGDRAPGADTAARIAATEGLIARLEGELAEVYRAGGEAREVRARHALAAAEGDARAQKALQEASEASFRVSVDAENVEMAIGAARERLAGLRELAERERLAREREEALVVCDRRAEAARAVDEAFATLARALAAWQGTAPELRRLRDAGQRWLPPDLEVRQAIGPAALKAGGGGFARLVGRLPQWVHPDDLLSLAGGGDPVLLCARRERGEEVDTWFPAARRAWQRQREIEAELGIVDPAAAAPPADPRDGDGDDEDGLVRQLAGLELLGPDENGVTVSRRRRPAEAAA